jgi:hypothetical protein
VSEYDGEASMMIGPGTLGDCCGVEEKYLS